MDQQHALSFDHYAVHDGHSGMGVKWFFYLQLSASDRENANSFQSSEL
jgi:hypothetical protein